MSTEDGCWDLISNWSLSFRSQLEIVKFCWKIRVYFVLDSFFYIHDTCIPVVRETKHRSYAELLP